MLEVNEKLNYTIAPPQPKYNFKLRDNMTLTETDVIYACHVTVEFLIGSLESLDNLELICALEEE